jgi:hypothetical protein
MSGIVHMFPTDGNNGQCSEVDPATGIVEPIVL